MLQYVQYLIEYNLMKYGFLLMIVVYAEVV